MKPASPLTERLMEAVLTQKQDALANGTDGTPRVRQRLDVLVEAIGLAERVGEAERVVHPRNRPFLRTRFFLSKLLLRVGSAAVDLVDRITPEIADECPENHPLGNRDRRP